MNIRKEIRNYLIHKFKKANVAKRRVSGNRFLSLNREEWCLIYTLEEDSKIKNAAPREYQRDLFLVIEGAFSRTGVDLSDLADDFAEEIERHMENDRTIGGLVQDVSLEKIKMDLDQMGETPTGRTSLIYRVKYIKPAYPEQNFDELMKVKYSIDNNIEKMDGDISYE